MEPSMIEQKIRADVGSTNSFILINPEPLNEISPTLPEKFPSELIPKELCEKQLNDLMLCMIKKKFNNPDCEEYQGVLYKCKKWRDNLIISRIKEWESGYYKELPREEKKVYLDELKDKKSQFMKLYEQVPVLARNKGKRIRISSDIQQVVWRISYLEDLNKLI
jgi:hypothetical protein